MFRWKECNGRYFVAGAVPCAPYHWDDDFEYRIVPGMVDHRPAYVITDGEIPLAAWTHPFKGGSAAWMAVPPKPELCDEFQQITLEAIEIGYVELCRWFLEKKQV